MLDRGPSPPMERGDTKERFRGQFPHFALVTSILEQALLLKGFADNAIAVHPTESNSFYTVVMCRLTDNCG